MTSLRAAPLVVVTVGGDHHPFDRLIAWVDDWLAHRRGAPVRCFVQHGTAPAPRHADGVPYLPFDELQRLMAEAHVVVSSGGPATLTEARRHGHVPIAVPRQSALGEVVDDHQLAFATRLATQDLVVAALTAPQFREAAERALAEPRPNRRPGNVVPLRRETPAVTRTGGLIDGLLAARARRRVIRLPDLTREPPPTRLGSRLR